MVDSEPELCDRSDDNELHSQSSAQSMDDTDIVTNQLSECTSAQRDLITPLQQINCDTTVSKHNAYTGTGRALATTSSSLPHLIFNFRFGDRLRLLQLQAQHVQYQLACLSTLGGAYHLCNDARTALVIARRQEMIGLSLGATSVIVRSKVFQAVNYALLGKPKCSRRAFAQSKTLSEQQSSETSSGLLAFIDASELWVKENATQPPSKKHLC